MKNERDEFTLDLFGGYMPPPTGLQLGHALAKVAADNAGESWKKLAYETFVQYARMHHEFTTEQVRADSLDVPTPPEPRAWGHIVNMAKRNNIIEFAGITTATSRKVHGMRVTLWRSKINY
jgi:hypothetical protein